MLKIVKASLTDLVEDPKNPRSHDEKNLAAIKASLEKFGQVEPLVVQRSSNMVVGGNGRLAVMRELGWKDAQVVFVDVDDANARQLSIVLNRTAELADWNTPQLASFLAEFKASEINLESLGFDEIGAGRRVAAGQDGWDHRSAGGRPAD